MLLKCSAGHGRWGWCKRAGRKGRGDGERRSPLRHSTGSEKKGRVIAAGAVGVNEFIVFKLGTMGHSFTLM